VKKRISILLLLIPLLSLGQLQNFGRHASLNELSFVADKLNKAYDEADGSRYINTEFVLAKINNINELKLVRFNVVENTIEVKQNDDRIMTLSNAYSYVVRLADGTEKVYETLPYTAEKNKTKTTFFEVVYTNEFYGLYRKENIKFIPKKTVRSGFETPENAQFIKRKPDFYMADFRTRSEELVQLPRKRKLLNKVFKEHYKVIDQFVKKEGLDLGKENDLIKMLNFYMNQSDF